MTPERSLFWLCLPDLALAAATLVAVLTRLFAAPDPRSQILVGFLAGYLVARGWLARDWFAQALVGLLCMVELASRMP
jgi:hypothetical protein